MIIVDDENYSRFKENNAGSKARIDISSIFARAPLITIKKTKITQYLDYFFFFKKIKNINSKDVLILNYPLYNLKTRDLQRFLSLINLNKVILVIHDLNSLRYSPNDNIAIRDEIMILNKFKVIVSHNRIMTRWLKANGTKSRIIDLDVFDYLGNGVKSNHFKYHIAYAGNLSPVKSKFIYEMIQNNSGVSFEIFGSGFDSNHIDCNNYSYLGSKKPEELLSSFHSKFGLIWDGDSIDTCQSDFGEYLKYNNPHKLSLYISAQLPVIVWDQSAISYFVCEQNIGISISNLHDLSKVLNSIKEKDYKIMEDNIIKLSKLVKQGYYITHAIKQAEEYLNEI